MKARAKLDAQAIDAFVATHADWRREGDHLVRDFVAVSAREALRVIQRIGDLAEGANHHPELFWVYNKLNIQLTTHDSDGITSRDTHLAGCIDEVLADAAGQ